MHRIEIGGGDEREEPAVRPNNGVRGQGPVPPPRRSHTRARELGGSSQQSSAVVMRGPLADAQAEGTFESAPMSPPDTHSAPLRPGRVRTGMGEFQANHPPGVMSPEPAGQNEYNQVQRTDSSRSIREIDPGVISLSSSDAIHSIGSVMMGEVSSIGPVGGIRIESVGSAMLGVASVGAGRHHMVQTRGSEGSITGTEEPSSSGEDAEIEESSSWSQRGRDREHPSTSYSSRAEGSESDHERARAAARGSSGELSSPPRSGGSSGRGAAKPKLKKGAVATWLSKSMSVNVKEMEWRAMGCMKELKWGRESDNDSSSSSDDDDVMPMDDPSHSADDAAACRQAKATQNWYDLYILMYRKMIANDYNGRRLTIYCGGIRNDVWESSLRQFPGTLLHSMVTTGPLKNKNVCWLDRNPYAFMDLLSIYRAAKNKEPIIVIDDPQHISNDVWVCELIMFRMQFAKIAKIDQLLQKYQEAEGGNDDLVPEGKWRRHIYLMLDEPTSGMSARCYSFLSFAMIFVSIFLVIIETLPVFSEDARAQHLIDDMDFAISVFMTVEYLSRFAVSINKGRFLTNMLNIVDVIAILPSYATYFFVSARDFSGAKLFRVIRVLRIFKLGRHSDGMVVMAKTAEACSDELGLLLFCLLVSSILFSSLVYFAESQVQHDRDVPYDQQFVSIPHGMWWAVVTMTTIGYGDMYPVTGLGQALGVICALSGVVMVAVPISVLSMTFSFKFAEHMQRQQVKEQRRKRANKITESVLQTMGTHKSGPYASLPKPIAASIKKVESFINVSTATVNKLSNFASWKSGTTQQCSTPSSLGVKSLDKAPDYVTNFNYNEDGMFGAGGNMHVVEANARRRYSAITEEQGRNFRGSLKELTQKPTQPGSR